MLSTGLPRLRQRPTTGISPSPGFAQSASRFSAACSISLTGFVLTAGRSSVPSANQFALQANALTSGFPSLSRWAMAFFVALRATGCGARCLGAKAGCRATTDGVRIASVYTPPNEEFLRNNKPCLFGLAAAGTAVTQKQNKPMKKTNRKSQSARGLPAKPKHQQTAGPDSRRQAPPAADLSTYASSKLTREEVLKQLELGKGFFHCPQCGTFWSLDLRHGGRMPRELRRCPCGRLLVTCS